MFDTLKIYFATHEISICIKRSDTGAYEDAPSISSRNGCVDHFPDLHIASYAFTTMLEEPSNAQPNITVARLSLFT